MVVAATPVRRVKCVLRRAVADVSIESCSPSSSTIGISV